MAMVCSSCTEEPLEIFGPWKDLDEPGTYYYFYTNVQRLKIITNIPDDGFTNIDSVFDSRPSYNEYWYDVCKGEIELSRVYALAEFAPRDTMYIVYDYKFSKDILDLTMKSIDVDERYSFRYPLKEKVKLQRMR